MTTFSIDHGPIMNTVNYEDIRVALSRAVMQFACCEWSWALTSLGTRFVLATEGVNCKLH